MRLAMLSPVAWRTPPRHYGPWEQVVHLLTEGLVKRGIDVTLFATADSVTAARLESICPCGWEEDREVDPKVWECLHISHLMERAHCFDLIHNNFDFLPLTYSNLVSTPIVTTIHGFSSQKIIPVYKKYNDRCRYVSISFADRSPELRYTANVYHGIEMRLFPFEREPGDYLLFYGRIHPDKGVYEAIEAAKKTAMRLIIAGIVQDREYFARMIEPELDGDKIVYIGSVGPDRRGPLLAGAYALLHLINFNEPFGLSMVEAMACGTPVIARPRGSIPEIIADKRTGFHVSDIEEAAEKIKDVGDLKRAECRRWVEEKFGHERMVDDYIAVYRKILEGEEVSAA